MKKLLELDKQNLLVERKELGEHFSYEIEKYEKEQFTMKQIIATLENEKNEIRNSNSYKLGIFSSSRYIMDIALLKIQLLL